MFDHACPSVSVAPWFPVGEAGVKIKTAVIARLQLGEKQREIAIATTDAWSGAPAAPSPPMLNGGGSGALGLPGSWGATPLPGLIAPTPDPSGVTYSNGGAVRAADGSRR